MREYIETETLIKALESEFEDNENCRLFVSEIPTADVISKGLYEQIKFERDIAMEQLQENSIEFGAEVKRGKWIYVSERSDRIDYECTNCRGHILTIKEPDYILAYKRCPNCGAYMDGGNE